MKNGQLIKTGGRFWDRKNSLFKIETNLNGIKKFQSRLIFSVTCKTIYYHFSNVSYCTWVFCLFVLVITTNETSKANAVLRVCRERCVWDRCLRNNTKVCLSAVQTQISHQVFLINFTSEMHKWSVCSK